MLVWGLQKRRGSPDGARTVAQAASFQWSKLLCTATPFHFLGLAPQAELTIALLLRIAALRDTVLYLGVGFP